MPKQSNDAPEQRPERSRGNRMLIPAGIALFAAVLVAGALAVPSVAKALALGTTQEPARFTELYFNNTTTLPKVVKARRPAVFSYHITNDEGTAVTYEVKVSLEENGVAYVLDQGSVVIAAGRSENIPVSFVAPKAGMSLKLDVTLVGRGETIYFRSQS